jgi:hypothetical protein
MKLVIMSFYPASCHFILLRSKYSPKDPVLKHPHLCPYLNERGQVSHPYKTTDYTYYIYGDLGVGGRIILHWILNIFVLKVWAEFMRLEIRTMADFCERDN